MLKLGKPFLLGELHTVLQKKAKQPRPAKPGSPRVPHLFSSSAMQMKPEPEDSEPANRKCPGGSRPAGWTRSLLLNYGAMWRKDSHADGLGGTLTKSLCVSVITLETRVH